MKDCSYYIDRAVRRTEAELGCSVGGPAEIIPSMAKEDYPINYILDVSYGNKTEAEKADIYLPEEIKDKMPCLIEVHGGGWYFGRKSSVEFKPFLYGLKRGYILISAGYTLSPEATYPAAVEEIKGLIRFLRAHADEYHIDGKRIALWGGSAGAQLAGLAAMDAERRFDSPDFGNIEQDSGVNACVLWYGCYNYDMDAGQRRKLHMPLREGDYWTYRNYLGCDELNSCREVLHEMNPENHISLEAPPVFLQHGDRDTYVPYLQSVDFYEKLVKVVGSEKVTLEILSGYEHADDRMFEEANVRKVFDFLDRINGRIE